MRKIISSLIIFVFTANIGLFAEGKLANPSSEQSAAPPSSTHVNNAATSSTQMPSAGSAAIAGSEKGRKTSLRNWTFAGAALVLAAIGAIVVATNSGDDASHH